MKQTKQQEIVALRLALQDAHTRAVKDADNAEVLLNQYRTQETKLVEQVQNLRDELALSRKHIKHFSDALISVHTAFIDETTP